MFVVRPKGQGRVKDATETAKSSNRQLKAENGLAAGAR